jgi:hypothetical protein
LLHFDPAPSDKSLIFFGGFRRRGGCCFGWSVEPWILIRGLKIKIKKSKRWGFTPYPYRCRKRPACGLESRKAIQKLVLNIAQ